MAAPGTLYIISAPSGTGKTTLVKKLVESFPDLTVSISHTTRPKRPAEIDGINYYFIDEKKFQEKIKKNEFLEYATVFDYHYGTSRQWVEDTLTTGIDVILEIDWQGSQQIQRLFTHSIGIFILPPSLEILSQRLIARNQDNTTIIKQRLADAKEATSHIHEYHYVIINDDFETAVNDLKNIILAGRLLERQQSQRYAKLLDTLSSPNSPKTA